MSIQTKGGYHPEQAVTVPPIYTWPPRLLQSVKWLCFGLLYPWGFFWILLSVVVWQYLTPSMETMQVLAPGWIAAIWLRNVVLLLLVAGGLHWWLYMRRRQDQDYKFNTQWMATNEPKFLWGDQVKDNMFWSLASGCTVWSAYESLTFWWYASGHITAPTFAEAPAYTVLMVWFLFFWSTTHFYLNHRLLHWQPIYNVAHELHHRNTNTGPWSGISMHPLEHLIYFSVVFLWWFVPVHPVLIILLGIFHGLSPAVSHSGFNRLQLGKDLDIPAGDNFHHLHHRFFHVNYGNTTTPWDRWFGSWHDGKEAGRKVLKRRMRSQTT